MSRNISASKRGFGYDYEAQSLGLYVDGVMVESFSANFNKNYYVDKATGSDSNDGRSWASAFATYQAGVTAATAAANVYINVDLYIGPAEYDEQVVVSETAQGASALGYAIGTLRIIHMTPFVILKNSTLDSSYTLKVERSKVEIHGGLFRNYTNAGTFSAVCFERLTSGGTVLSGLMRGCRVEGRSSAEIGVDLSASYKVTVEDCVIQGFTTGMLLAGNSLGNLVDTVVRRCLFTGNTNDIEVGASSFTLLDNNLHYDDATTKFVTDSTYTGRQGTIADLVMYQGMVNGSDLTDCDATNIAHFGVTTTDAVEW